MKKNKKNICYFCKKPVSVNNDTFINFDAQKSNKKIAHFKCFIYNKKYENQNRKNN